MGVRLVEAHAQTRGRTEMPGAGTLGPKPLEIYFAHTLNTYDTPLEGALRRLIAETFRGICDVRVEDPNQPHHQEGYEKFRREQPTDKSGKHGGMNYFFDVVLKPMLEPEAWSACVCQTYLDGKWGLGVAGEAGKFIRAGKPVWKIDTHHLMDRQYDESVKEIRSFVQNPTNGLFFLRKITPGEERMILEESPLLVVPHMETRLRTWLVYNKVKRPLVTAHFAPKEPYPGFYPDEDKK